MGKISELKVGQGSVEVSGTLKEIGDTRVFNKFGRELKVANAILQDESGSVKLTLWNNDVSRFKDGDHIKVVNGYVNEFQGEKQLTSGKFGSIEKVGEGKAEKSEKSEKSDKKVGKKKDMEEEGSEDTVEQLDEDSEFSKESEVEDY